MAGATGGASAAAAAAAIANATKASGAIVKMDPSEFEKILQREDKPLVVIAVGGLFSKHYKYLTSYRGLFFYSKSKKPMRLDSKVEVVMAENIWIPG